jgi:hypothetical protein
MCPLGATGAMEAGAPVAGIAVRKSMGGAVNCGGPVTLPSNGATVLGWVKVGMVEGAGVFGWVEVGIAVPKSMGGAVKRGGPVTLPSNGAGDMDRTGVGAATGTADGAGVMVHRLGAPGVPLSPPMVHRVVELHQFFPSELSNVSFLNDIEEPSSLGKLGPLSHSTRSTSTPIASFIIIISTSPRENP